MYFLLFINLLLSLFIIKILFMVDALFDFSTKRMKASIILFTLIIISNTISLFFINHNEIAFFVVLMILLAIYKVNYFIYYYIKEIKSK